MVALLAAVVAVFVFIASATIYLRQQGAAAAVALLPSASVPSDSKVR